MTKALAITTREDRTMMYALGRLRNRLVHNAKDTSFTFRGKAVRQQAPTPIYQNRTLEAVERTALR